MRLLEELVKAWNGTKVVVRLNKESYERVQHFLSEEDVVRNALGAYITLIEKFREGYWIKGKWTDESITTIGEGKVGEGKEFCILYSDK